MSANATYERLTQELKEIHLLSSCGAILSWDERVNMPRAGSPFRADQLALIQGIVHERFVAPKIGDMILELEQSDLARMPESPEAVNIRELRHAYDKHSKLPKELVEEISKTTTLAQNVWVQARKDRDFKAFLPWLEKVVDLTIKKADAYGYTDEPYTALLDDYEPGATTAEVEKVLGDFRKELVQLVARIQHSSKKPDESIIERNYPVELQRIFGESVAAAIGFDFHAGRLDITTHPFCSGIGPGDTRITTRYNPNRLNDALFGIMHESGHALYEMGLDKAKFPGQPMAESTSLGIHESQSRMWENQVGRSKSFWKYFYPQAQRIFKEALGGVALDDFYGAINAVKPSYIRVEADEATYNLHILLRFELERALVKRDLKPKDAASEWRSRFEKYFGIKVDHDSNGCLQDIHWSAGLIGYFPTYSLGNLYAGQFFAKALDEMPGMYQDFEAGRFMELLSWLRKNIHYHGQRYRATDLVEKVTGKALTHKPLMAYMEKKFGEIYDI